MGLAPGAALAELAANEDLRAPAEPPSLYGSNGLVALWTGGDWLGTRPKGPARSVVFASMDAGPAQVFTGSGFKWAVTGRLADSGPRLLAKLGGTRGDAAAGDAAKLDAYALFGGEMLTGRGAFGLHMGFETAASMAGRTGGARTAGSAPAIGSIKPKSGLRIQAELWDHPTPHTLVQLTASAGSARGHLWLRAAGGYELIGGYGFLGPEGEVYLEPSASAASYAKFRYGAHLTGLRLLGLDWKLSAGREHATRRRPGLYATLGVHWTR